MGWKFRRRVRLFPGFYLNLSKSGMSATVGMRGFSVNVGQKGAYLNTGIPGTGIYDRTKLDDGQNNRILPKNPDISPPQSLPANANVEEIKSYNPELITSEGLFGLKESILNAQKTKEELLAESQHANSAKNRALFLLIISSVFILGFLIKWFRNNYKDRKDQAKEAKETHDNFKLEVDFNFDNAIQNDYITMKKGFTLLTGVNSIWDVTTSQENDRVKTRSAAEISISRQKVSFAIASLDFLNTKYDALKMSNANGGDLFIYPGFIVMVDKRSSEFGLVDFRDLRIEHHQQRFIEQEQCPPDTKIVDNTWRYVNKDGLPDKRFKDNYKIPIALYYDLSISTNKGFNERYQFSNPDVGADFCNAFKKYKEELTNLKWASEKKQIEEKGTEPK
jgi:Protein of unknown function (DUF4236)